MRPTQTADSIHHDNQGIFVDLPNPFTATRYHSLVIEPGTLSDDFEVAAWADAPDGTTEIQKLIISRALTGVGAFR